MKKTRVAIVGCGNLGSLIAQKIEEGVCGAYEVEWAFDQYRPCAEKLAHICDCKVADTLDDIISTKPDFVIEASTVASLKEISPILLEKGISIIALSVGALADVDFYNQIYKLADDHDATMFIPTGAAGGFDLMAAAVMGGGDVKASITTRKNPRSLVGAPHLDGIELSQDEVMEVFSGNAREAIAGFPQNVNVAVATGVATVGVEKLVCKVISDPSMTRNRHTICLSGDFGDAKVEIEAKPSPNNPKSSLLAAISVLTLLKRHKAPIAFG